MFCPLCSSPRNELYFEDKHRPYFKCSDCALIFVPPEHYLSIEDEKAQYQLHENSPTDKGYRDFLSQVCNPLKQKLKPNSLGLDFGCGPGPTLSVMLEEAGHKVSLYDPFFTPNTATLKHRYDFVTCTEVAEHLHQPGRVFEQLVDLLKPGGWLAVMTQFPPSSDLFERWYYKNDPTHVCFFSIETLSYLGNCLQLETEFFDGGVILLQKKVATINDSISM